MPSCTEMSQTDPSFPTGTGRSIVVTTNLLFKQWDTVFPNASCAVALIDRLTHHAEIIPIEGESYRKREAELAQKKRRAAP